MSEEKTYYEVQLDALNSIDKLKDKKAYCEKVDFSKCIEKDSDAQLIKDIKVFSVFPLKEIDKKKYGFNCVSCGEKITSETSPTKCVCGGTRFKNIIEYSKEEIKDELKNE